MKLKTEPGQKNNPYERFLEDELILRDQLAADRTILANERTFLSYLRTGLGFAAAGVALIHLFASTLVKIIGWALIPVGAGIVIVGIYRYIRVRKMLIHFTRTSIETKVDAAQRSKVEK